jgi:hypothetical protein
MISLDAGVRTLIAETVINDIDMFGGANISDVNELNATFTVKRNVITDDIFGAPISIVRPDVTIDVTSTAGASDHVIEVNILSVAPLKDWIASTDMVDGAQRAALLKILETLYAEWCA